VPGPPRWTGGFGIGVREASAMAWASGEPRVRRQLTVACSSAAPNTSGDAVFFLYSAASIARAA
jgi:hypothetical protein